MQIVGFSKHWLVILVLPCIMALTVALLSKESNLADKIIVIDAGHGGIDTGANRPGVVEKDINLAVALELKKELNRFGTKVILTREQDVELSRLCDNIAIHGRYHRDLNARIEMVEKSDANMFISIHANASSKPQRSGIECYYYRKSESGKALAQVIQQKLSNVARVSQDAAPAQYFVLKRNKVPAVLIEVGYITNSEELKLLRSQAYQQQLAVAITQGVVSFYQNAVNN